MKKQTRAQLEEQRASFARAAFAQNNDHQKKYLYDQDLWLESAKTLLSSLEQYKLKSETTFKFPKTKDKTNLLRAYIRHCYVKYPVHDRWYDIFNKMSVHVPYPLEPKTETLKHLSKDELAQLSPKLMRHKEPTLNHFLTLVSGGSLHKQHFSNILTKKETHTFVACPYKHLSLAQALVYSVAKGNKGTEQSALILATSKFSDQDINDRFWYNAMGFFAQPHTLKVQHLNDIVDYLLAQKREDPEFSITGRGYSIASVVKRTKDWHFEVQRAKQHGDYAWNFCTTPDWTFVDKDEAKNTETIWTCTQITTSKELSKEGTAQHHCVSSYHPSCRAGTCSIWSMRMDGERKLTIEVSHSDNTSMIKQVRGFANRKARYSETQMVKKWAYASDFDLESHVFND